MGITIKCRNCSKVLSFEEFFVNHKSCPECNKEWDYSKIKHTKFRKEEDK
tara:strand:- start:550 stop:699 length:150 start_codon:yes stop_codon:yes gene_type:complete